MIDPGIVHRSMRLVLVALGASMLASCGGGGGGSSRFDPKPPPSSTQVTVSGKITFDRIGFVATPGGGLNPNAPIESPARGVVVEALSGTAVVARTATDANGNYSLEVPGNTQIIIRAKAQMLKTGTAPTWNFSVLNNTNGNALFALDSAAFNTGTSNVTRNLHAASGWGGSSYTQTRAAAPFAILDTVYSATVLILGAAPSAAFPKLDLFWSPTNTPTIDSFCIDRGDIGTTFYTLGSDFRDECNRKIAEGIYILGNFTVGGDTDEFDQHVIAHEFGHYFEMRFSRSDSIGGNHEDGSKLDLRVAFGEGWGNAFSGMALNNPVYRDSYRGFDRDFGIDLEQDGTTTNAGWFSEFSVGQVLWDIFDSMNEPGDTVTTGFTPIFNAMTTGQRTTPALTSIFSFLSAIKAQAPAQAAGITQLHENEQIFGRDEFGTGESNAGGDASVLPIFRPLILNQPPELFCVSAANGVDNGLGFNKFFRLTLTTDTRIAITVMGAPVPPDKPAAVDPDFYVFRAGEIVILGTSDERGVETMRQQQLLRAGTYIVEVHDYDLFRTSDPPRCMTISVTGN